VHATNIMMSSFYRFIFKPQQPVIKLVMSNL
jgi:hypothetical protein